MGEVVRSTGESNSSEEIVEALNERKEGEEGYAQRQEEAGIPLRMYLAQNVETPSSLAATRGNAQKGRERVGRQAPAVSGVGRTLRQKG